MGFPQLSGLRHGRQGRAGVRETFLELHSKTELQHSAKQLKLLET